MKKLLQKARYLGTKDLLPALAKHEIALHYVIGVLCALACLAAIIVSSSHRAAQGWSRDIRSEVTVQVRASGLESPTDAAAKAAEVISGVKGVDEAAALEPQKAKDLIKPWLGDAILDDLPIPNLVAVRLNAKHPASVISIKKALDLAQLDASVDDHSIWLKDIEQSALIVRLISLSIFIIVGSATAAAVSFATRAGLAVLKDVVEVLSLCGATDIFVAERFQYRFGRMAFEAGLMGSVVAALLVSVIKLTTQSQSLAIALPFVWSDLLLLIPCPLFVAGLAAITARFVTLRLLQRGS